ncbi:P27 family phage terminase small subunit [Bradyrhizobium pachyrhizi]|uniref:P27 family phage terminase small subunit n=1 Tax=Bradyrhizobium pachyrhizi TaxID=280333 RepID=UPI003D35EAFD
MAKPAGLVPFPLATIPEPPEELGPEGQRYWRRTMTRYVLDDLHEELLKLLCLDLDYGVAMRKQVKAEGMTVIGSQGQPVVHPLIAAEAACQRRIAAFMRQLGLFEEEPKKPGRPPGKGY